VTPGVIIRKQKIKIRTSNEQLALHVRKQLNDTLQYELIALLDRIFTKYNSPDIYLNIDQLKIDLGSVSMQEFEKHFLEFAEPKLENELKKNLEERNGAHGDNASDKSFSSPAQQEEDALFYFLKNGIYPWWYKKESLQTPAQLFDKLRQEEIQSLLLKIISAKRNQSDDVANKIITRLFIHLPGTKSTDIIDNLLALYNNNALNDNIKAIIKNSNELVKIFSISLKQFYEQLTLFLMFQNIQSEKNAIYNFILRLKNTFRTSSSPYPEQLAGELKKALEAVKEIHQSQNIDERKQENNQPREPNENEIYISNAGLILLHPFLQSFFAEVGLLNEQNHFISVTAQQKAAVLLYYLQCCDESYKEWEMTLNKIICGIAHDEVMPDDIVITEKEKEESKNLLQAVANYWDALKGASIEALQNTFLLRDGKITWKEDYWLIQVERSGVDILLERLPWSFATVKLPWLNSLIYTEW